MNKNFWPFIIVIVLVIVAQAIVTYKESMRAYGEGPLYKTVAAGFDARICLAKAFTDGSIMKWYYEAEQSGKPIDETFPAWADNVLKECGTYGK